MDHSFTLLTYVPGFAQLPYHIATALFVAIVLVVLTGVARLKLAGAGANLVPDGKVSILNIFEMIAEGLFAFVESMIGKKDAPKFFPLIGALFLFIFFSNVLGLFPGMLPPTQDMNTTLAMGLFVFVYYNWIGIKEAGFDYLKHFFGPVVYIAPLLFVIELISHAVRPFSLALRLSGNMTGDHMVLGVMTDLAPAGLGIPIPFYCLGLMICFIQAFVFSLLTMVYIAMARDSAHH